MRVSYFGGEKDTGDTSLQASNAEKRKGCIERGKTIGVTKVGCQAGEGTAWYASSLAFAPKSFFSHKSEDDLTKTTWVTRP